VESSIAASNQEAIEAWNGPLFDRFVRFRHVLTGGLGAHGERAIELTRPQPGERVLDIGCGFGDTAQRIAELVGPDGSVLGVDAAERFIEWSREDAAKNGVANVRFEVRDVEATAFDRRFDLAFSRMGTMFFGNPVAALRNVRRALEPGGRLCMVVWRRKLDNDWMHAAELVVKRYVDEPEETDEPRCGPGPFSMADADTVSAQLLAAGFEDVAFARSDIDILMGLDMDEAVELVMAIGPAGELLRMAGDDAKEIRPKLAALIRDAFEGFVGDDGGLYGPSSTWIVQARAPAARPA
jgi:ubiquinone/menaquinone biosynthesis C-methylase UbiE